RHPFRPSHLTTSLRSEPEAAREAFEDVVAEIDHESVDALTELESAYEELKSAVEDYRSQREEALDAWENGNGQLEELLDTAQSAVDELESFEVEEWDGDEGARDAEEEPEPEVDAEPDADHYDSDEDYLEAVERWERQSQA